MKLSIDDLKTFSFAIYGLGKTGKSIVNFFKKNKIKNYFVWDDHKKIPNSKNNKQNKISFFNKKIDEVDFIILSPGIDIGKSIFRKKLIKNYKKIISDLDLFYLTSNKEKTIVITGTNGKSTACKLIEHILKKRGLKVSLGGNIGKPIMDIANNNSKICVIEASSFQLNFSKYVKPTHAAILNLTKDHIEWHKTFKNYINSKLNIFALQSKTDLAFLNDKKIIKLYKQNKFRGSLKIINSKKYNFIQKKIINSYLLSKANELNMKFIYQICKYFKISDKQFINFSNSFRGLKHRQEVFFKKKNLNFINDSKATSFESTKYALMSYKNIFWIVGGLPKLGDKFLLKKCKNNIIKAYIIGKRSNFFKKAFKKKIKYTVSNTLKKAIENISKDINQEDNRIKNILFSPASASYDQFNNFEERGELFKNIIKKNAAKLF